MKFTALPHYVTPHRYTLAAIVALLLAESAFSLTSPWIAGQLTGLHGQIGTAAENIACSRHLPSTEEMKKAAKAARADRVIKMAEPWLFAADAYWLANSAWSRDRSGGPSPR